MEFPCHLQQFIAGRWCSSSSSERIPIVNPATEEPLGSLPRGTGDDIDRAVTAAHNAFRMGEWRRLDARERAHRLRRIGQLMLERADEIARVETLDQGRPFRQSRDISVPKSAFAWEFYAGVLIDHMGRAAMPRSSTAAFTIKQPIGVVGCITPGNVPLVLACEKLAPALAAGNSVVLKPPPECPLSSALLMECIAEAGIPSGVINLVFGDADTGRHLVKHTDVEMIAFTGSTAAGKEIMRLAADNVKRLLLELGGKAPQIICEDADLEAAVDGAMWGAYYNGGQVCMAVTRILVQETLFERFIEQFVARTQSLKLGPGIDPASELGPMVSADIRDRVEGFIERGVEAGATVLCGGERLRKGEYAKGFWIQPTVFKDVTPDMEIFREEIFGPVPAVVRFSTIDEAISLANRTRYGLSGSIWTQDIGKALAIAEEVQAGYVWVNDHLVRMPGFPFGGWKESGFGREAAAETLNEYSHTKTIHIDPLAVGIKTRSNLLQRKKREQERF
jgi:acyl-CoA reductase-like NAD-dependent aldehyde dehydrogenase